MNLFTFTVLSFLLFFGCVASLGLSYDEEQLELSKDDDNSKQLTDSFTTGQRAFLFVGTVSAICASCTGSYLLMLEIMKNG